MALGRFMAKRSGPGGGLKRNGKLKKGCRWVKSGKGGARISCTKRRKKGSNTLPNACKKIHVSRERATKRNGRLKKGCRFTKGGAICLRSALRRKR